MNNDTPPIIETTPQPTITLGKWLQQARLASGLSANDIALRTSRTVVQINGLEADDYRSFNAHVALRGMVRQYAKIVGADENYALQLIPAEFQPANQLEWIGIKDNKIPVKKNDAFDKPWLSRVWFILLFLVVAALLVFWIFGARFLKHRSEGSQKISAPNQVQVANPPASQPVQPIVSAAPTPSVAAASPNTPVATVQNTTAQPTSATGSGTLGLKINGDVWVDIKDAKGQQLLFGIQRASPDLKNLSGELPLYVKIADGAKVEMSWKGQPYDLKPAMKGHGTVVKIEKLE